jgi:hypothetical protein
MKYLKKFESFAMAEPATKPTTTPGIKPTTTPRPSRPSPIRRDKPSVEPAPKASAEDVAKRFIALLNDAGDDIKTYVK